MKKKIISDFRGKFIGENRNYFNVTALAYPNKVVKFIEQSLSQVEQNVLERVSKEVIGEDEEDVEQAIHTVDGRFGVTVDLSRSRNDLRFSQRLKLQSLINSKEGK